MRSRRFRLCLLLAALAGLASCEINPQPPLPAKAGDPTPGSPAGGGTLNLGTGGSESGPVVSGGSGSGIDTPSGGSLSSDGGADAEAGGEGGASTVTPEDGGAGGEGGATDAGGAAGGGAAPAPK